MTEGRGKAAPAEGEFSPGPSVPGSGGPWGERRSHHKAKGRRPAIGRAPFSFLRSPTTRKEKIGNSEYKITAWLGRETRVVIEIYDDPNRAAKEAAEARVRHILK